MKRIFISFQCRGTATKGPIKNDSPHSENWLRRAKGSLLKIISPMNPLNLLNHREAVCLIQTSSCGTIERIERR